MGAETDWAGRSCILNLRAWRKRAMGAGSRNEVTATAANGLKGFGFKQLSDL